MSQEPSSPTPSPPRARASPLAWWVRGVVALIVVVAIGLGICEWLEWPFLERPLERSATDALGRPVRFEGDFGVRLLGSIRLRTDRLTVADGGRPAREPGDMVRAEGLRVAVPWSTVFALWRQKADQPMLIRSLVVKELDARFVRQSDGRSNWTFGRPGAAPAPGASLPRFGRLVVEDGRIRVLDDMQDLKLDLKVRTDESTEENTGEEGDRRGLQVRGGGTYRKQPVKIEIATSGVIRTAGSAAAGGAPAPLHVKAALATTDLQFDGSAGDLLRLGTLQGEFELSGPSLASTGDVVGVTLPTTAMYRMAGHLGKSGPVWAVNLRRLDIGSSRLAGEFRFDQQPEIPSLTGRLAGTRLALADLAPAFGAPPPGSDERPAAPRASQATKARQASKELQAPKSSEAPLAADPSKASKPSQPAPAADASERAEAPKAPDTSGSTKKAQPPGSKASPERVLPQREFDIPSLAAMNAEVAVAIDQVSLGTAELEQLANLKLRIVLQDRVLKLERISALTAAGRVSGALVVDTRTPNPTWRAEMAVADVRMERFVKTRSPVQAKGGGDLPLVSGELTGEAKLRSQGRSTARVLANLDGTAEFWVGHGRVSHLLMELAGIDIAQSLGLALSGDKPLAMRCAVAQLDVKKGVATPRHALIDTSDSTLLVTGELSFAQERLALLLTSRPRDFSPAALRAPVRVEGTFANPRIAPDLSKIGLRLGAAAILAAVVPIAAVLALVDVPDPDVATCRKALESKRAPEEEPVDHAPRADPSQAPERERRLP